MNTFLRIQPFYDMLVYQWTSDFQCFECNMILRNARNTQWHSITSRKTWILSNTAVRTPNLANIFFTTTAYVLVVKFYISVSSIKRTCTYTAALQHALVQYRPTNFVIGSSWYLGATHLRWNSTTCQSQATYKQTMLPCEWWCRWKYEENSTFQNSLSQNNDTGYFKDNINPKNMEVMPTLCIQQQYYRNNFVTKQHTC